MRSRIFLSADIRLIAFISAVLIYGLAGTPTPDRMGVAEIATGLLLIAAAGGWQAVRAFRFTARPAWERAGQALLFYGLTVPVIAGLAGGGSITLMLRDLIPFLFFLLPLFLP